MPYSRAPHVGASAAVAVGGAHNAALLIDFDNVTMGRRSDLSKELKSLLESDIIKGKVAVQRAYADWRRYPQYIVPLSEASIDLIFAPAYGSSKKNATDIRMAIDALELVFIRPEIGTFILLTGDSDFSSLVLKLKEYGKYVIGVGIQESSSDILVQNCDEYYSYTSLTGLTKTTDAERVAFDPWVLVDKAIRKMAERRDVMRSDRLKQVMIELDPGFEEREHGFPKFSKFLAEASARGLIEIKRMENGQYEVTPGKGRKKSGRRTRRTSRQEAVASAPDNGKTEALEEADDSADAEVGDDPLQDAYDLLVRVMGTLKEEGRYPTRDSDVKRRLLQARQGFDEAELGFSKFSKFLQQADAHGIVSVEREDHGPYFVVLPADRKSSRRTRGEGGRGGGSRGRGSRSGGRGRSEGRDRGGREERAARGARSPAPESQPERSIEEKEQPETVSVEAPSREDHAGGAEYSILPAPEAEPAVPEVEQAPVASTSASSPTEAAVVSSDTRKEPVTRGLQPRVQRGRKRSDGPPPIMEGQAFGASSSSGRGPTGNGSTKSQSVEATPDVGPWDPDVPFDAVTDGLPGAHDSIVRYLAHRYKGVGEKTAEAVVEAFGTDVFRILHEHPDRLDNVVPHGRASQLVAAWRQDYQRRAAGARARTDGEG